MHQFGSIDDKIRQSLSVLSQLETGDGGYYAALSEPYKALWPRDAMNCAQAKETVGDFDSVKKTYDLLFNIYLEKMDFLKGVADNKQIPQNNQDFLPSKYVQNKRGLWIPYMHDKEPWQHHQFDAIAMFMYKVADLKTKNIDIGLNKEKKELVKYLFRYCVELKCFEWGDNGKWEQERELHSSSMGAVLSALHLMKKDPYFDDLKISDEFINFGKKQLAALLPRECWPRPDIHWYRKQGDAAQLTLMHDYDLFNLFKGHYKLNEQMENDILTYIETNLVREKGVMRFLYDDYVDNVKREVPLKDPEPRLPLFFAYLSAIYTRKSHMHTQFGNHELAKLYHDKAIDYLDRVESCMIPISREPIFSESYYKNNQSMLTPNINRPFGWAHARYIIALHEYANTFLN